MNSPGTRSAPAPACIRPNSTVPNTTSSRPEAAATTRAHTMWNTVAALTPSRRACSRSRPASPSSRASTASSTAVPSWCTSVSPNGAVDSVTSPSRPAKNRSCSAGETPSRARATKFRNGSGTGSILPRPSRNARDLTQQHLQPGVVLHQVVDLQQRQPPATALRLRRDEHPQQRRGPEIQRIRTQRPAEPPPDPRRRPVPPRGPAAPPHGPPPGPAHAAPATPPRTAECHAGRSPAAPRTGKPPAAPANQTPAPSAAHTHHPPQPHRTPHRHRRLIGRPGFTRPGVTRGEKVVEEDALLQGCQRVDVRHVRRAARHPGDHPRQLRVTQPGQRHHLRR